MSWLQDILVKALWEKNFLETPLYVAEGVPPQKIVPKIEHTIFVLYRIPLTYPFPFLKMFKEILRFSEHNETF